MRAKIEYAYQVKNVNAVYFRYNTGTVRTAYLGDSYYVYTGTQRKFMDKAKARETYYGTIFEIKEE